MPPQKRAHPAAPNTASSTNDPPANWKKRKHDRAQSARHIQTQQPRNGSAFASSSSAAANTASAATPPSRSASHHHDGAPPPRPGALGSTAPLPPQLDLEDAIASRAFQIRSFQKSLKSAKTANTTRAWQLLPRHARRRAASHNLLRLPTRLRTKAHAELTASKTLARSRSDIRKRLPSHGVVKSTLRRQKLAERAAHPNRRWLETHLWHAKRFRMSIDKGKGKEKDQGVETSRWGFVLPETTMMKSHKASWRSALEKVTLHDASYFSVFRVAAERVLDAAEAWDEAERDGAWTPLQERLQSSLDGAGLAVDWTNPRLACGSIQCSTVLRAESPAPTVVSSSGAATSPTAAAAAEAQAAVAPVRIVKLAQPLRFVRPSAPAAPSKRQAKKAVKAATETSSSSATATATAAKESTRILRVEALVIAHPAAALDFRRALKRAGVIMTDEHKAEAQLAGSSLHTTAVQLDSAPSPWVAAGGKDASTSRLKKRKRAAGFGRTEAQITSAQASSPPGGPEWIVLDEQVQRQRQQGYNIFELVGPDAGRLLASVLRLVDRSQPARASSADGNHLTNTKEAFQALKAQPDVAASTPSSAGEAKGKTNVAAAAAEPLVPNGSVLAFEVHDPRLSFPPKIAPAAEMGKPVPVVPSAELARSRLLAVGAAPPRFSKGEIDSRRAKLPVPGTRLKPDSRDDVVPVVVIKRQLAVRAPHSESQPQSQRGVEGYTLLVPRGWGMAFFLSLSNTHQSGSSKGARVLGQAQLEHQCLEIAALRSGVPVIDAAAAAPGAATSCAFEGLSFPRGWIGTRAYAEIEKEASRLRREQWQRRPKGKRVEHVFVDDKRSKLVYMSDGEDPAAAAVAKWRGKLRDDRLGTARPYPFGGVGMWEWVEHNSETLFADTDDGHNVGVGDDGGGDRGVDGHRTKPWLVPLTLAESLDAAQLSRRISEAVRLGSRVYANALVPIKLTAVRKGTVDELSSVLLPSDYHDQQQWIQHVDASRHPLWALCRGQPGVGGVGVVLDRETVKREVERRLERLQMGPSAPRSGTLLRYVDEALERCGVALPSDGELDMLHSRSADWNRTVGIVVSGDYALAMGKGFGIAAVTLKAWMKLVEREQRRYSLVITVRVRIGS
ncbi:hypothetical protein ACQY0O_001721 [Thecaphora frezii]